MPSRHRQSLIANDVHFDDVSDAFDTSDVFDDEQGDFYDNLATGVWDPIRADDTYEDEAPL